MEENLKNETTKDEITKAGKFVYDCFMCPKHRSRDLGLILIVIGVVAGWLFFALRTERMENKEITAEIIIPNEEIKSMVLETEKKVTPASITDWKIYRDPRYGFQIKYPSDFAVPRYELPKRGENWTIKFVFEKAGTVPEMEPKGFYVSLYNLSRVKELNATLEYPKIKDQNLKGSSACENLDGHIMEVGDFSAEEIYISKNDECFNPVLFFSATRPPYIYNMAPVWKNVENQNMSFEKEMGEEFGIYLGAVSSFELIDIVVPKPLPQVQAKPKSNAPYPVSFKKENGRLVCAKKNDKPSKSDSDKGKHMDMECCLDPDEIPNPHCYYDPNKYGKYLK